MPIDLSIGFVKNEFLKSAACGRTLGAPILIANTFDQPLGWSNVFVQVVWTVTKSCVYSTWLSAPELLFWWQNPLLAMVLRKNQKVCRFNCWLKYLGGDALATQIWARRPHK
jgi:hypothetical protein